MDAYNFDWQVKAYVADEFTLSTVAEHSKLIGVVRKSPASLNASLGVSKGKERLHPSVVHT